MKKIYNITYCVIALVMAMVMTGCSTEADDVVQSFNTYDFKVSVTRGGTRGFFQTQEDWNHGSIIYFMVDDDADNLMSLTYDAENKNWNVGTVSKGMVAAFAERGTLKAVYSYDLSYTKANGVRTKGDVLYTTSGSYYKNGNSVYINLEMSQRDICELVITGIPDNFPCIKGFKESSRLDFATMTWKDGGKNGLENRYQIPNLETGKPIPNAYVYYGMLTPDNSGHVTITLTTEDGTSSYSRTYAAETLEAGKYYEIKGPLDPEEGSLWTANINSIPKPVFTSAVLNLGAVTDVKNLFTFELENPTRPGYTVTSSKEAIATVDANGMITAKNEGTTIITIQTPDSVTSFRLTIEPTSTVDGLTMSNTSKKYILDSKTVVNTLLKNDKLNTFAKDTAAYYAGAITYTTSDATIATVDAKGKVTMLKPGNVTVTGTGANGAQFSYAINIKTPSDYVSVTWGAAASIVNKTVNLTFKNNITEAAGKCLVSNAETAVTDIVINDVQVEFAWGEKSSKINLLADGKQVTLAKGKEQTFAIGMDPSSLHYGSKATVTFTYNGVKYTKEIKSSNVAPN